MDVAYCSFMISHFVFEARYGWRDWIEVIHYPVAIFSWWQWCHGDGLQDRMPAVGHSPFAWC